jgi:hypothetical protein
MIYVYVIYVCVCIVRGGYIRQTGVLYVHAYHRFDVDFCACIVFMCMYMCMEWLICEAGVLL